MAISQHTRFENHMDVASPETMGDAKKESDFFDENPYDDEFESKLSKFSNIASKDYGDEVSSGNIEDTADSDSVIPQKRVAGGNVADFVPNSTKPSLYDLNEIEEKGTQRVSDIPSSESGNSPNFGNLDYHRSFQQIAERIVAVATAVDTVGDVLSGGIAAIEQPNRGNIDEFIPQTSILSNKGHHDARSIDDAIDDLGFEVDCQRDGIIKDSVVNVGQAIELIGNDEDNQAEFVDEQNGIDSEKVVNEDGFCSESGDALPSLSESEVELRKNIVFSAIADANPEYGVGGGTQYFIQYAADLKQEGKLKLQHSPDILEFDAKDIIRADIRTPECSNYKINLDTRNMTEKDAEQIFVPSGNSTTNTLFDMADFVNEDELKYLDENTIATEGLTNNNDEFFMNEEGKKVFHEDYFRPHGNQEDAKGKTMPDGWRNPEKLEDGKIYYQLSPLFSDGYQDTKSSYFTDAETVDECRDKNGVISVAALLQKLQIEAKKEIVQDDSGAEKEVYVNKYVLSSYVYKKKI